MIRHRSRRLIQIGRIILVAVIIIIVLSLLLSTYFIPRQTSDAAPRPASPSTAVDLGITYLPLTGGVSAYYDLGVESGALITEVASNSLADRAGLKVGDVILSFNGSVVEKGVSLLSMVRQCPEGDNIIIEVCREKIGRTVSFLHSRTWLPAKDNLTTPLP